jgi:uncharacterized protein involved in oxidation of intracellular sulfur
MKLLFIITKGLEKAGSATRAMEFATLAAQQGNQVEVFLIDEAVHWAQGIRAANGKSMNDYLSILLNDEYHVHVCKSCTDRRHISPDDLIEGVIISSAPTLVEMMASPDYKVFTF